jgi:hypothetical protein
MRLDKIMILFSLLYRNLLKDPMEEEICLADSGASNTILREVKYFQTLKKSKGSVMTIGGRDTVIVGSGQATFTLPNGTRLMIQEALLYPDSTRTLLSFKDIQSNGYHIETHEEDEVESLLITQKKDSERKTLEKLPTLSSGLYCTYIKPEPHLAYKIIFQNLDKFKIWHDRLGHPGVGMMRKIIDGSIGDNATAGNFPKSLDFVCTKTCATG